MKSCNGETSFEIAIYPPQFRGLVAQQVGEDSYGWTRFLQDHNEGDTPFIVLTKIATNAKHPGFTQEEYQAMSKLVKAGFALCLTHPNEAPSFNLELRIAAVKVPDSNTARALLDAVFMLERYKVRVIARDAIIKTGDKSKAA